MGILRVVIDNDFEGAEVFEIPSADKPEHNNHVYTACKRNGQFVDIAIIDGKCDFGNPAMQNMLRRLGDPRERSIRNVVHESVTALRTYLANAAIY